MATSFRGATLHQDERRGAIAQARCVSCRDAAIVTERGSKLGQGFRGGVRTRGLVDGNDTGRSTASHHLDGNDFVDEGSLLLSSNCLTVALQRVLVLLFAGDIVHL